MPSTLLETTPAPQSASDDPHPAWCLLTPACQVHTGGPHVGQRYDFTVGWRHITMWPEQIRQQAPHIALAPLVERAGVWAPDDTRITLIPLDQAAHAMELAAGMFVDLEMAKGTG